MNADLISLLTTANLAAPDEHDAVEAAHRAPVPRDSWRRLPRCSRCGRWIGSPGGAGFGDGKTYCEACAVRLDFERGDGRTR